MLTSSGPSHGPSAAYQRPSSSSNSASVSSTVTVHRGGIPQQQQETRPFGAGPWSQGSSESNTAPTWSTKSPPPPSGARRQSSGHSRSNSTSGTRDSVGNYNRWSQSTTSSATSTHKRTSSFTKRFSVGATAPFASLGALATATAGSQRNNSPKNRPTASSNNARSPETSQSTVSIMSLPPVVTLPSLAQAVSDAQPLSSSTSTPKSFGSPDYFGETWHGKSVPKRKEPTSKLKASAPVTPLSSASRFAPHSSLEPPRPYTSSGTTTASSLDSSSTRRKRRDSDRKQSDRGHSRNRDGNSKGSGEASGTGVTSSSSSVRSRGEKSSEKQPSQKAMLSKALQKANTAVQLDNALNFAGAMEAYQEACALLGQVMQRSSGDDDKRKLEAIRNTYTNRIAELDNIAPQFRQDPSKALPARPESNDYIDGVPTSPVSADSQDAATIETATVTRIMNDTSYGAGSKASHVLTHTQIPPRRESLLPSPFDRSGAPSTSPSKSPRKQEDWSGNPRSLAVGNALGLKPPMDHEYMPPPLSLSPRPPPSPTSPERGRDTQSAQSLYPPQRASHSRSPSTESTSWLDTIDESGGSSASSVHSRSSQQGLRRKRIRAASGATEAGFDAALDDAIEAAYGDGFEPAVEDDITQDPTGDDVVSMRMRNVELAKERVREAEREAAIQLAKDREKRRLVEKSTSHNRNDSTELEYGEEEAEEEERMLEEMTRGYIMDDFEFDLQSKSALPRESDSSGFSGRTWGSSIGSNPTTAGTSLQTLSEAPSLPMLPNQLRPKAQAPLHPPPTAALPPPPTTTSTLPFHPPPIIAPPQPPSNRGSVSNMGVRSRRLSGQNHMALKIETIQRPSTSPHRPITDPPSMPPPRVPIGDANSAPPKTAPTFPPMTPSMMVNPPATAMPLGLRRGHSPLPDQSPSETMPSASTASNHALTKTFSQDSDISNAPRSGSPRLTEKRSAGSGILRKNYSSQSLKNRNLSVSSPEGSEVSPSTPLSHNFSSNSLTRKVAPPTIPALPTPTAQTFTLNGLPTGGLYLFDSDIHSPTQPGTPNPILADGPHPLEPCPSESAWRPFWLMRCLYQTLTHPKGGYLTTALFVPRDAWRVKVSKIKGLEEKISSCDLLTAALLKLDQVDTIDADAVLEEMQALEHVLDQVQAALTKKLGSDVGVQGSAALFKDAPAMAGGAEAGTAGQSEASSKQSTNSGKSYLSWRRLRNKNSGVGVANNVSTTTTKDSAKEALSMASLPMTTASAVRHPKRDVGLVPFSGPNANYMSALARLFDAAQVLDQIARQVEDPGLKHSSQTQVGLELSTRHAAEFFAFYICRFVLADLGTMLDKFIKRGSEWAVV